MSKKKKKKRRNSTLPNLYAGKQGKLEKKYLTPKKKQTWRDPKIPVPSKSNGASLI